MGSPRVLIFVDESNVLSSVRALGRNLHWIKLRDFLTKPEKGRELIEMVVYAGLPPPMAEWPPFERIAFPSPPAITAWSDRVLTKLDWPPPMMAYAESSSIVLFRPPPMVA